MAKINIENFSKEVVGALEKAKEELLSETNMKKYADELVEQIRTRTRLGDGLAENNGEPSKLKPLSSGYIEQRKTMSGLSGLTTPKKSNLTQTGQMLDNLEAKVNGPEITITFKDQFAKDKARWNAEKGRPFLAISRVQVERLKNSLNKRLTEILKKYF